MAAADDALMPAKHSRLFWALLPMLAALGPLAIDMYLSAMPSMAQDLDGRPDLVQWSLSSYFFGMAVSMLLCGPLSDRLGRRVLLLMGLVVYALSSLACAMAPDAWMLLLARLLQALGGGVIMLLSRTVLSDFLPVAQAARMGALMLLIGRLAPLVSPWLGGEILVLLGWRWIFGAVALFALACLVMAWAAFPETLGAEHRSRAGNALAAYRLLLGDRMFLLSVAGSGLTGGSFFAYLAGSPFIYMDHHGATPREYGMWMALAIVSMQCVHLLNRHLLLRVSPDQLTIGFSRAGVTMQLCLLLAEGLFDPGRWITVLLFACTVAIPSPIQINTSAVQASRFRFNAASAMALQFASFNVFGMIGSAAVPWVRLAFGLDEPLATVAVMSIASVASWACIEGAARTRA